MFDIFWLYSGLERFGLIVARNACIKAINIGMIFAFVRNPNDLWKYIMISFMILLVSKTTPHNPFKTKIRPHAIDKCAWSACLKLARAH